MSDARLTRKQRQDFKAELETSLPGYIALENIARGLIANALNKNDVNFLNIQSRVKTPDSADRKLERKKYLNPISEMTDILGIRVIVYLNSDIDRVENSLRALFEIDDEKSIDKRKSQRVDQVGYRSLHLICKLGNSRRSLPEYTDYFEHCFEVQVRTALEHAWAEIEHKQNYKSQSQHSLPSELQRRLMIISGTLELVDQELSSIAAQSSDYHSKIQQGDTSFNSDPLSVVSMVALSSKIADDQGIELDTEFRNDAALISLISELNRFGVYTVAEFAALAQSFPARNIADGHETNLFGYVRDIMIANDPMKYFSKVYQNAFTVTEADMPIFDQISEPGKIRRILNELSIEIDRDETSDW